METQSLQGLKSFIYMVILYTVFVYVSKDLGAVRDLVSRERVPSCLPFFS